MSKISAPGAGEERRPSGRERPRSDIGFDWTAAILGIVWMAGVFVDGWAHQHGEADETFFTPWHALFYAGWAALGAFLVLTALRNRRRGYAWKRTLPSGYGLSLLGVILLGVAGVGDLIWHEIFGLETTPEVLFSPTHLGLAFAVALSVSGPLRATYRRPDSGAPGWSALGPMLLSATATLSELTFLIQWCSPVVEPYSTAKVLARHLVPDPFAAVSLGVAGILLQSGLLIGMALLLIRRWTLPLGFFTLMLTLNALGMGVLHDEYVLIPLGPLGGVAADLLLWRLRPSVARKNDFRLYAFAAPATYFTFYFIILMLSEDIVWSVHQWAGAIVLAGTVGWLLSFAFVAPMGPVEDAQRAMS